MKDTNKQTNIQKTRNKKKNTKLIIKKTKLEDLTFNSWKLALLFELFPTMLKCGALPHIFFSMKMEDILKSKLESKVVSRFLSTSYYRSPLESFGSSLQCLKKNLVHTFFLIDANHHSYHSFADHVKFHQLDTSKHHL